MDNIVGIRTKHFSVILADMTVTNGSILAFKTNESKCSNIYDELVLAHCGDFAKGCDLLSLYTENIKYCAINAQMPITSPVVSNLLQNYIHDDLRRNPSNASFMLIDKNNSLYAIDQYGALMTDNYICFGYSRFFLYGLIDSMYDENMTSQDAINLLQKSVNLMKEKFMLNYVRYQVNIFENGQLKSFEIGPQTK